MGPDPETLPAGGHGRLNSRLRWEPHRGPLQRTVFARFNCDLGHEQLLAAMDLCAGSTANGSLISHYHVREESRGQVPYLLRIKIRRSRMGLSGVVPFRRAPKTGASSSLQHLLLELKERHDSNFGVLKLLFPLVNQLSIRGLKVPGP